MDQQNSVSIDSEPSVRLPVGRLAVKAVLVLLVLGAALTLVSVSPLRNLLNAESVERALAGLGLWAVPVFILVAAALASVGFPRLLICFIGGAVFGVLMGLIISQTSTIIGSYLTFLFVRWGGRDFVLQRWPKIEKLSGLIRRRGVTAVMLARQLPISSMLVNLTLGLTRLRHRDFLLGTLLGVLPTAIPAVLAGAGAISFLEDGQYWKLAVPVVIMLIVWICFAEYLRRSKSAVAMMDSAHRVQNEP